jgi:tRNA threonylcarbamoyladenosine biosynthesis protein TsaB
VLVLALDTSGRAGGAALAKDGAIVAEVLLDTPATHSRRLLAAVDFLLEAAGADRAELGGLAVAAGPGYFTGLRIGLATACGLALGLGIPAAGVSSLRLVAEGAARPGLATWAVTDARRGLVYAAPFSLGPAGLVRTGEDTALAPERLAGLIQAPALLAGDGARAYSEELAGPGVELAPAWADLPRPGLLALIGARRLARGEGVAAEGLRARYVRPSEAEVRFGLPLEDYRLVE